MRVSRTMITPYAEGPARSGSGIEDITVACRYREPPRAVAQYNGEPAASAMREQPKR
jgi:hypothetical protein